MTDLDVQTARPDARRELGADPVASSNGSSNRQGRVLWAVSVAAIVIPFLFFPVSIEAGVNRNTERPLGAVLRAFDRALAATGYTDIIRMLVWLLATLTLVSALVLLWIVMSDVTSED